jgi:hypothetical protein
MLTLLAQMMMLAQMAHRVWGIQDIAIAIIVIVSLVAAVVIVVRASGIQMPWWVPALFWVVLHCFCGIIAVRIIGSM